ncbi:type II secretion system minor pseudopilin GspK [Sphingomonas sp.]|jgi:general secretion pathway protein K|uniref:type II secretion system minor pseudopilin GspK n=1 Tax=Sphingomonas sp. TaxID=28214 RepID=UPI002E306A70|nr:type II secretion system minor pseudopilin GspK [Sphingomonas sp.]HEX4693966.1 type II secretion system minor pseudopilin GspK [Sphingomonas sp.]
MQGKRASERGAALLTVLLLVAIVGAMAAGTMEKLTLATRQASNANAMEQANAWSRAAATMALVRIEAVLGQDRSRVSLAGGWSDHPFPLPIPEGTATARVLDAGNCFNLNSLVVRTGADSYAVRMPGVLQFARLMRLLGVAGGDTIAAATADWIDSDGDPIAGGAEDAAYSGFQPVYRPANTLMADVSELRAVVGVTPQIYAALRPYVCALPTEQPTTVNVNTLAPERGALIAAMAPDTIGVDQVRRALLSRPAEGWASTSDFWSRGPLSGSNAGDAQAATAVTTHWFALTTDVAIGRITLHQTGLIDARRPRPRLVALQSGEGV